ncbi:hypothetical protein Cni_G23608 [Canna indica]|uniref:Uncharacterized protein n=1 Tax=Canna indica TaxID=4628 RepID=A0AAQ3KWI9_9LILI|nr:hypothetical protein Cni_G23608 [Canna indica]
MAVLKSRHHFHLFQDQKEKARLILHLKNQKCFGKKKDETAGVTLSVEKQVPNPGLRHGLLRWTTSHALGKIKSDSIRFVRPFPTVQGLLTLFSALLLFWLRQSHPSSASRRRKPLASVHLTSGVSPSNFDLYKGIHVL